MTIPKRKHSYRWNHDRAAMLRRRWLAGDDVSDIAEGLSTTRSAVISKAAALRLGEHPKASSPHRHGGSRAVAYAAKISLDQEPVEREMAKVRLPSLRFLENRLAWEK